MLKKGDLVSIKNSTLKGKILNIKKYKNIKKNSNTENEYIILINNKKVHISESNLIVLDNNEKNISNTNKYIDNSKKINYTTNNIKINYNIGNVSDFIPEIMIRHKNVDEAIYELEDFINEAIYNKIYTVRIIHGKSGGILRKATHDYLKSNRNVLEFRLGNYFEGSYGVTIAKIKKQ